MMMLVCFEIKRIYMKYIFKIYVYKIISIIVKYKVLINNTYKYIKNTTYTYIGWGDEIFKFLKQALGKWVSGPVGPKSSRTAI